MILNLDCPVINKKGSSIPNNSFFYFVWDVVSQKYVNEFGFVLQNTGRFFIAQNNYKYENFSFTIENVPSLGYQSESEGPALFHSTFQTTGEGWFQFEVVE